MTDGRRVIVSFGSEGLYAYDFDGKLLWKRDLGVLNSGWFYDPDYEWGLGSSPIIWKNLVIVQCDIQKNSFIAAFDVATGEPVWRTAREEIPSWSTPTIFEAGGRAELVTQATTFTRGYDPATGKELWRLSGNSEIAIPTPIIAPGLIIVTNGYRGVQPICRDQAGRDRRHHAQGRGDEERRHRLEHEARRPVHPDARDLRRSALRPARTTASSRPTTSKTGQRVYQERLGANGGSFSASPVAADGKIYFTSEDGDVFVVKAGPTYELLATNPVGEVLMATPAISDGVLFFRGLKHVFAVGLK